MSVFDSHALPPFITIKSLVYLFYYRPKTSQSFPELFHNSLRISATFHWSQNGESFYCDATKNNGGIVGSINSFRRSDIFWSKLNGRLIFWFIKSDNILNYIITGSAALHNDVTQNLDCVKGAQACTERDCWTHFGSFYQQIGRHFLKRQSEQWNSFRGLRNGHLRGLSWRTWSHRKYCGAFHSHFYLTFNLCNHCERKLAGVLEILKNPNVAIFLRLAQQLWSKFSERDNLKASRKRLIIRPISVSGGRGPDRDGGDKGGSEKIVWRQLGCDPSSWVWDTVFRSPVWHCSSRCGHLRPSRSSADTRSGARYEAWYSNWEIRKMARPCWKAVQGRKLSRCCRTVWPITRLVAGWCCQTILT